MLDGVIEARRAAVLRGKVLDRNNQPLAGVTITVLDHPELGQTLTREDGMFDLAVNGGGLLTINYKKDGFLPSQFVGRNNQRALRRMKFTANSDHG